MSILVIGYGKIGRIKSFIWKSFGADVFVFDTNQQTHDEIIKDGFNVWKVGSAFEGLIDISTPAGKHSDAIKWCFSQKKIRAQLILVEKPLASTREELQEILDLLNASSLRQDQLYVNESYYQSTVLQFVANDIKFNKADITDINIEFSKNRLNDLGNGRFFDKTLEAIGIEVPHMIAILDLLNVNLNVLKQAFSTIYIDNERQENQAVLIRTANTHPRIQLSSFLGSFRENITLPINTPSVIRDAAIRTSVFDYLISFDPVRNYPRYYSQLKIFRNNSLVTEKIMQDDHLKNHLRLFMGSHYAEYLSSVGFRNAVKITDTLLELREISVGHFINLPSFNSVPLYRVKEPTDGTRI